MQINNILSEEMYILHPVESPHYKYFNTGDMKAQGIKITVVYFINILSKYNRGNSVRIVFRATVNISWTKFRQSWLGPLKWIPAQMWLFSLQCNDFTFMILHDWPRIVPEENKPKQLFTTVLKLQIYKCCECTYV